MTLPAHTNISLAREIVEIGARVLVEVAPHYLELRKHRHTLQANIQALELRLRSETVEAEKDRIQRYCDFYSSAISLSVSLEEKRVELVKDHFLQMTTLASALMSEINAAQHEIDNAMINSGGVSPAKLSYMRRRQNDLHEEKQHWHLLVHAIDGRFMQALTEIGADTREVSKTIRHLGELAFKSRR